MRSANYKNIESQILGVYMADPEVWSGHVIHVHAVSVFDSLMSMIIKNGFIKQGHIPRMPRSITS